MTATTTLLRPPRESDVAPIEALLRASGNFNEVEVATAIEMIRSALTSPEGGYHVLVAEREGRSLGYALYGATALTDGTFDLYWIAVHPDAHGKGVGKMLLRAVEDAVRERGGRLVVIETSSRADYEKARRLYERAGYERVGRIKDFYREGDDKLTYARRVDAKPAEKPKAKVA